MKLRAGVSALLLSFIIPAALTEAGLSTLPLAEREGLAQQADAVTEVARQRYEDGVKAFDTGRFEDARSAFLQAYALKRHPAVLLNLGQSELRAGYPEDGGNHLTQFLREHKAATPEQRATAEKGIAEAKRKTGHVIVIIDASGADVSLDGAMVGKSPLLDPVFVKPGKHTVFASYGGKSATTQVDAKIGSATAANLVLGVAGAAPPPALAPVPAPAPAPAPPGAAPAPPAPAGAPPGPPPSSPPPSYQPADPGGFNLSTSGGLGSMGSGPDDVSSGREPIFNWYKRKPLAWAGTGVAGVGLILGTTFSILAAGSSGDADSIAAKINQYAAENPGSTQGRTSGFCGPRDNPSADLPLYGDACNKLRDELDAYDTQVALAVTGWVFFGLGVAGTVTYAMLDWYPKKAPSTALVEPRITAIAPIMGPGQAGLGLAGTF